MRLSISTILWVFAAAWPYALYSQAQEESSGEGSSNGAYMGSMAAEDEAFLSWLEDPFEDLGLESDTLVIWSASLAMGSGYSTNFLKREVPAGSRFLKLESDFFINAMLENSTFMALLYVEGSQYDTASLVDNEAIILLHTNWTRSAASRKFGSELDIFAGDQIFDASLSSNAKPVGERLRQVRPDLTLFVEQELGQKNSLRLMLNTERVLYERSEDDYWRPGIEFEWKRNWLQSVETTSSLLYYEELYDEELSRDRRGFTLPSRELLHIRGYEAEQEVVWNPAPLKMLQLNFRAGASYEEDVEGEQDEALHLWSSLGTELKLPWLDLRIKGRWQSIHYQERQIDFFDERLHHQNFRSLRIEAGKELPWDLSLRLVIEWANFDSRISSEQFSDRRVETLLSWSY